MKSQQIDDCPICGEPTVSVPIGGDMIDVYCEECGWPDEDFSAPANVDKQETER